MEINQSMTSSSNSTSNHNFHVINSIQKANIILDQILSNEYTVIGIDLEAAVEMSRFGILCLIQVTND